MVEKGVVETAAARVAVMAAAATAAATAAVGSGAEATTRSLLVAVREGRRAVHGDAGAVQRRTQLIRPCQGVEQAVPVSGCGIGKGARAASSGGSPLPSVPETGRER